MIAISSEDGRIPAGIIWASTFWAVIFGILHYKKTDDDSSCVTTTNGDLIETIPELERDNLTGT